MLPIAVLTVSASYVGLWAVAGPRSFYDSFPGLHRVWVGVDGPFNEHLIRDVGGLYLALALAGVAGLWRRDGSACVVLGAAWTAFGVVHLSYHLHHLGGLATIDAIGNVLALGGTLALALYLLLLGLESARADPEGRPRA